MINFLKDFVTLLKIYRLVPGEEMGGFEVLSVFNFESPVLFWLSGFRMFGCTIQVKDGFYHRLFVVSRKVLVRGDKVQIYGLGRDGYAFARRTA